jgi:hypothetical protein
MRLGLLVFWSKDNVVREESMISADSTSPAGGGSGWVIQLQLFYFDAARVEAANSRNGKPADFKLMLGVYAFRGMLLGVGTGVTCYNYSDKRILVLSLAHCAHRGIITRVYSTIQSPNSKTDGWTSEPTTIFHIMIQIVIEHKTAQPTSYNPCFLCISLFWVAICISLLLLPSLTPDSTTVALRCVTTRKRSPRKPRDGQADDASALHDSINESDRQVKTSTRGRVRRSHNPKLNTEQQKNQGHTPGSM